MADKTAWGEVVVSIGTPGVGDTMAAVLEDIGLIKEDSVSIEKADGTVLQLFSTGHNLVDQLKGEPTLTMKLVLIGITEFARGKFWDTTVAGTRTSIKSMVNSLKYSVKLASKVIGSPTIEPPYCEISMGPLFNEKEGYTAEVSITFIKGDTGVLFYMDEVAAPEPPVGG